MTHFFRFFGPHDSFSSSDETSVNRLAEASRLAASLDIKSTEGIDSCVAYLAAIEAASTHLQIQPAARKYRENFPLNYRSLFQPRREATELMFWKQASNITM